MDVNKERISYGEFIDHAAAIAEIRRLQKEREFQEVKDPYYEEWKIIVPRSQFGTLSLVSGVKEFTGKYYQSFREGNYESFIDQNIDNSYEGIYRIKSKPQEGVKSDEDLFKNHDPQNLALIRERLIKFQTQIEQSNFPQHWKDEYMRKINGELDYIESVNYVATPEFSIRQKTPQEWANFIDVERSREAGMIVLPYEDLARQTLEKALQAKEKEEKMTVRQALDFWKLSDYEKEQIGYAEIEENEEVLGPEKVAQLLKILDERMGIGWEYSVDASADGITMRPKEKRGVVPPDRSLTGKGIIFVPAHEIFHAVRGANGARQDFPLLSEGVADYMKTEEGSGAACEMVMGENFGDNRQVIFAARYLAIAMALKAEKVNGEIRPQYTSQQIYDELKSLGVAEKDLTLLMWRIGRGTTLKHHGIEIPVATEEGELMVPAAECYVKDSVYFEGQKEVFEWMKSKMPVREGHRKAVTIAGVDFSDKTLARIGLEETLEQGILSEDIPYGRAKAMMHYFIQEGRDTLIEIMNVMSAGKVRLDMVQSGSPWLDELKIGETNGMIDYRRILQPVEG